MKKVNFPIGAAVLAIAGLGVTPLIGAADSATVQKMHGYHDAMKTLERAIIAGKLDAARQPATYLLENLDAAGLPAAGSEFVDAVHTAAQAVIAADTLEAAAEATSQMGLACGSCHTASGVTVEFDAVDRPPDKEKAKPASLSAAARTSCSSRRLNLKCLPSMVVVMPPSACRVVFTSWLRTRRPCRIRRDKRRSTPSSSRTAVPATPSWRKDPLARREKPGEARTNAALGVRAR